MPSFCLQCTPEQISTDLQDELMYQLEHDENLQKVGQIPSPQPCPGSSRHGVQQNKTSVFQILGERDQLPVKHFEEEIMAAIDNNPVVIIRGATGCGKTTQVPQYILDRFIKRGRASDCNIVVTQVTLSIPQILQVPPQEVTGSNKETQSFPATAASFCDVLMMS